MFSNRHANLKYKNRGGHFWVSSYVDTAGRNRRAIKEYRKNRLEKGHTKGQMAVEGYMDSFTGCKNKPAKRTAA